MILTGNPPGKQRRKRRRVSQRRKQLNTRKVASETIEKVVYLHDVEHKGFRKIGDSLGLGKDRAYRIYKEFATVIKKRRNRELDKDQEYKILKEREQEIERKARRALAIEEVHENTRNSQVRRARTSIGLEEIFKDPKEMLEFVQDTVKQCESLISYCKEHRLQPDQALIGIVGPREEYETNTDEEDNLVDLPEYIGSRIDSFLLEQEEEEKKLFLRKKFSTDLLNLKCSSCGSSIERFAIVDNKLVCTDCYAKNKMSCPRCKTELRVDVGSGSGIVYRCPSCKLAIERPRLGASESFAFLSQAVDLLSR